MGNENSIYSFFLIRIMFLVAEPENSYLSAEFRMKIIL